MQEFLMGYFGVSLRIGGAMIETSARGPSNQKEALTAWWNKLAKSPVCFPQLPVGGIKGKVLAAKGAGIYTVVLTQLNQRDLDEIPERVRKGMSFKWVRRMDKVIEWTIGKS